MDLLDRIDKERSENGLEEIVGQSAALQRTLRLAMKLAQNDNPVLILGEPGCGKELIARTIHRISGRKNKSFVRVNCSSSAEGKLDSDLFGQEGQRNGKGRKVGQIDLANYGTLFLDEISLIPLHLQSKILRLLSRGEFERTDSLQFVSANVRLIAATRYDLGQRVAEQTFRSDLYDQLNVFPIHIPSLDERREDIPVLARYFMERFARRMEKRIETIAPETMEFLTKKNWPGNVRQLENLIEHLVRASDGPTLRIPQVMPWAAESEERAS